MPVNFISNTDVASPNDIKSLFISSVGIVACDGITAGEVVDPLGFRILDIIVTDGVGGIPKLILVDGAPAYLVAGGKIPYYVRI